MYVATEGGLYVLETVEGYKTGIELAKYSMNGQQHSISDTVNFI